MQPNAVKANRLLPLQPPPPERDRTMSTLVIGGNSRLGKVLVEQFTHNGTSFLATSRRNNPPGSREAHLDFTDCDNWQVPPDISAAVIIAGLTNFASCENDPALAHQVNCVAIPSLARRLLEKGIFTCFISTNTVFKADSPQVEDAPVCPGMLYAQQKAEAEAAIRKHALELQATHLSAVLRITKNVSLDTSPFGDWLAILRTGGVITAFSDLFFAPVLFANSAHAITQVLTHRQPGIFHLSGEADISYAEFARTLVNELAPDRCQVAAKTSQESGARLLYAHPVTALRLTHLSRNIGLSPVPLTTIVDFFREALAS